MPAEYSCDYYIAQALQMGVTEEEILRFKQSNTNADGTWDCHRLVDAFGGLREVSVGSITQEQINAAAALPPPTIAMATTSGDPRMFLTLSNVPDSGGSAVPARSLAQYASSPIGMAGIGGAAPGGLNMTTILILLALAGAAWYLAQK
jgi:hypothetical protein